MIAGALAAVASSALAAGTFYVERGNPSCSDAGPGTSAVPYCTISAAITAHNGAGTTLNVRPGVYREQVTVPSSGASGSPFILQATAPGAIVDGADDFSSTALWSVFSGDVWRAASVTWAPLQVFADGARLTPSTAAPAALPANSFVYVAGQGLYVNAGGGNPGSHQAQVGRRSYCVQISGRAWVTLDGFTLRHAESKDVYVSSSSSNCRIQNNTVNFANGYGIQVSGGSAILVHGNVVSDNNDHGIGLTSSTTGSTVEDNESFRNARPEVRAANGIHLNSSPGNLVQRNRTHDNQDSGIQINTGSNNTVSLQNRSWNNGDHGFDHLTSTGAIHVGDVSFGNYKDGFSTEGNSPGASYYDCIAVDNGITTNEYDFWVDANSSVGLVSDYNIFWNSVSQPPIKIGSSVYSSMSTYSSATGLDAHSIQANPRFANAAGGDFHLLAGSPAIDSGHSGAPSWPALDAEGHARVDDLGTPNTGVGPISYADRGALEVLVSDQAPVVVAPASVTVAENGQLIVTVTASDPDGHPITSLSASLGVLPAGHNAVFSVGPGNTSGTLTWTPTYADSGSRTMTFTASNALSGSAQTLIRVTNVDRAPVVTAPATVTGPENAQLTVVVTASDPDGDAITALTPNLSTLPAGSDATFTPGAGNTGGTLRWTPTYSDSGNRTVSFIARNALTGNAASTQIRVTNVDRAPVVMSAPILDVYEAHPATLLVTATDPDGDAIVALNANLASLPAGHTAAFTLNAEKTMGTLQWTPTYAQAGVYNTSFSATSGGLGGSSQTQIRVLNVDRAPVLLAPTSVAGTEGSPVSIVVTASDPDGQAIGSLGANLASLPAGAAFTQSADHTRGTLTWTPGFDDAGMHPLQFTASNTKTKTVSTAISVENQDRPPLVVVPPDVNGAESNVITITVHASDPDGNPIGSMVADLSHLPAGHNAVFSVNPSKTTGVLTWTPRFSDSGSYDVTFAVSNGVLATGGGGPHAAPGAGGESMGDHEVRDGGGGAPPPLGGSATVKILVSNVDRAPDAVSPPSVVGAEGAPFSVVVTASDPDGDALTLSAVLNTLPPGNDAAFTPNGTHTSGTFTWTPTAADAGSYLVRFIATANGKSDTTATTLDVGDVDRAPVVVAPASVSGAEGAELEVHVTASDADGDALVLTPVLSGLPAGNNAQFTTTVDQTSGTLRWTPTAADAGTYTVSFIAAANGLADTAATSLIVANVDRAPVVTAPESVSGAEGSPLTVLVSASDPDSDALTLTPDLGALPPGNNAQFSTSVDQASGTLTWTPTASDSGRYTVSFVVTAHGLADTAATTLVIANVDRAPVVTAPESVPGTEGVELTMMVTAADPDGDALTLTPDLSALPPGNNAQFTASGDHTSATLTWTPTTADAGSYLVSFIGSAHGLADTAATTVVVANVDRAPVVTAPDSVSGAEGAELVVQVTASDPDGDAMTLTPDLSGLPAGHTAQFTTNGDHTGGTLTWTPTAADAGEYTVSFIGGANGLADTAATRLIVANVDQAPVVTAPASAPGIGLIPLSVTVTASDADGDAFTLSADLSALPAGNDASFTVSGDQTSGTLTWTPALTDLGTYSVTFIATNALADTVATTLEIGPTGLLGGSPGGGATTADARDLSGARAFTTGEDRAIRLGLRATAWQVHIEPAADAAGDPAAGSAVTMVYGGRTIQAIDRSAKMEDADGNGIPEILASFAAEDLRRLLQGAPPGAAPVTLAGIGASGRAWRLSMEVPIAAAGPLAAVVTPNPLRTSGVIDLVLSRPGRVVAQIFDSSGRRVRRLADATWEAGFHRLALDGRGDDGHRLPAGVYFYRVQAVEGTISGRFTLMR